MVTTTFEVTEDFEIRPIDEERMIKFKKGDTFELEQEKEDSWHKIGFAENRPTVMALNDTMKGAVGFISCRTLVPLLKSKKLEELEEGRLLPVDWKEFKILENMKIRRTLGYKPLDCKKGDTITLDVHCWPLKLPSGKIPKLTRHNTENLNIIIDPADLYMKQACFVKD